MTYHRCFFHLVWATHQREPLIVPTKVDSLFQIIRITSEQLNAPLLAINAMPDHVHLAVHIPPILSIADYVKRVKGVASHTWNDQIALTEPRLRWQKGYGVVTFGERQLPIIAGYIQNQQAHHQSGMWNATLENTGSDE